MKKILPLLPLMMSQSLQAQTYFYNDQYLEPHVLLEAGWGMGRMQAFTDLDAYSNKRLLTNNSSSSFSASLQARIANGWGLRLQLGYGQLQGADSNNKADGMQRLPRNLQFRSPLLECALLNAWEPLDWLNPASIHRVNPVLLAGVGYYHFDPQAYWQNEWHRLSPLCTEGQGFPEYPLRKPYSLHQFNLLFGAGIRLELHARWMLRMELLYRHLFTDYLDDVSTSYIDPELFATHLPASQAILAQQLADRRNENQRREFTAGQKRGNPGKKDSYASLQLTAGYILNRRRR